MTPEEKFKQIALSAKAAIEDFNELCEYRAIAWAYDEIKSLRELLQKEASNERGK